jgi:demethylmenaquinone methyltransferase/2-methoxy-6-polyprenyl-1,4-benzoquinol methylase
MLDFVKGPPAPEIQSLFSSVAHGYDRANDWMTFGLVRLWRRKLVKWSGAVAGDSVLDCATGTGDLAFEFKRVVGKNGRVLGTDFCEAMLSHAPTKALALKLNVDFQTADVMRLPFPDSTFDVCSIGYGIRNVEDPVLALAEMARVVKPGGTVIVIETGDTKSTLLNFFYDLYFKMIVPRVGGWVTGRRSAYEYLNRSSQKFPSREKFTAMMRATHLLKNLEYRALMGGASYMYKETRLPAPEM